MCWITFKKPVKLIAKEDIIVQKVICRRDNGRLKSPCKGNIIWSNNINIILTTALDSPKRDYKKKTIHEGFHSAKKLELVSLYLFEASVWCSKRELVLWHESNDVLCEFIIPKGATYYVNENDAYVSNKIMFTGKIIEDNTLEDKK